MRLLHKALAAQFSIDSRVKLLNTDVLKLDFNSLLSDDTEAKEAAYGLSKDPTTFKVIANLPYGLTTPILWKTPRTSETAP